MALGSRGLSALVTGAGASVSERDEAVAERDFIVKCVADIAAAFAKSCGLQAGQSLFKTPPRPRSDGELAVAPQTGPDPLAAWTKRLLQRRPARLVTVALANKLACVAWAIMTTGDFSARKLRQLPHRGNPLSLAGDAKTVRSARDPAWSSIVAARATAMT